MPPADVQWVYQHQEEKALIVVTDMVKAKALSTVTGKKLVVWADCKVEKHKDFATALRDAIHVETTDKDKHGFPHVMVEHDGNQFIVREELLNADKAVTAVKKVWARSLTGGPTRPGIGVSEEIE